MNRWIQRHPLVSKFLLISFGICFAFVTLEVAVKLFRYYQCKKISNTEIYKKIFSDERDKDYVYGHKPNVEVRLEKEGRYVATFITNSDGLREKRDHGYIDKSVIFLGDSIIEGATVENDETMSAVFEKITGITALNFGLAGSNTAHEYYWLKSKYKKDYNTKLIVLGFCVNDFEQNTILRCFDAKLGMWRLHKYLNVSSGAIKLTAQDRLKNLLMKSRAIAFFYNMLHKKKNALPSRDPSPSDICEDMSKEGRICTELYMTKIKAFARSIGAEFIVVVFPDERQLMPAYDGTRGTQNALEDVLQKNDIHYIDLYEMMRKDYRHDPEFNWYYDDLHFNRLGHKFIGEYLARKLPEIFPKVFIKKE